MSSSPIQLRQRAELTYKQNRHHGRHGWLRLTPAYSVRLVEKILQDFGANAQVVFDPFSGSGTTALCAAYQGKTGVATDINPFLIWLSNAKARHYEKAAISSFEHAAQLIAKCAANPQGPLASAPPLSNIERWWRPAALTFLLRLKAAIDAQHTTDVTLLKIAFCRTLMKLSNASFNHQSMSFKAGEIPVDPAPDETESFVAQYLTDVGHIAHAAADNPPGRAEYVLSDARGGANAGTLTKWRGGVDLVVTSPPYPNRMSYIRELRPYMYWLQFLTTGREAGELDWRAIGGTWGVATSRLTDWNPARSYASEELDGTVRQIRGAHRQNGPLLANYVHRYFEDMFEHLTSMVELLSHGATLHYIIGNSIFYGHMVAAETYLADQMATVGLHDIQIVPIRKRNSKKGLIEFHVMGTKA
jgi:hypothetical protein